MTENGDSGNRVHYGWYIVGAGFLCIFACLGLGRFALGMLLPSMGSGLSLTPSQMGLISTVNFVGYLAAVLLCGPLAERFGARRVVTAALLLIAVSMVLVGRVSVLGLIILFYALTGFGSGAANVTMMALVSAWFSPEKRGRGTGFVVIGSGFAFLLCGWLIPFVNQVCGNEGWRTSWLLLGLVVLGAGIACYLVLRDSPAEIGLRPYGMSRERHEAEKRAPVRPLDKRRVAHMAALYFIFGLTYVIYVTFIVTSLIQDWGFSEAAAGRIWSVIGLLSILSGPLFGGLSDRIGRRAALVAVFAIQTFSYLLAALKLPTLFVYLSTAAFGVAAWSIPSIMAALVGDTVGPEKAARVFGLVTFALGIGQIVGPLVAGWLAELTGSFRGGFAFAATFTLVGVGLALLWRPPADMESR
jgi:MFS family permease